MRSRSKALTLGMLAVLGGACATPPPVIPEAALAGQAAKQVVVFPVNVVVALPPEL